MNKILTAINDPNLNKELRNEKDVKVICKDIQYKEGILEILEKETEIDYIIIDEKLPGEITLINLIEEIYEKNEKIKIILTIKKDSKKNINLKNEKIIKIYYDNKINLNELKKYKNGQENIYSKKENKKIKDKLYYLNKIKNKIIKFKIINKIKNKIIKFKIINKIKNKIIKFEIIKKIKNKIIKFEIIKKIKNKLEKLEIIKKIKNYKNKKMKINNININNNKAKKIIILGESKIGKSVTIINLVVALKNKKNKILIIDFNSKNTSIYTIFGCKKINKKVVKRNIKIKNKYQNIKGKFKQKYLNKKIIEDMIIKINKNIDLISYNKLLNFDSIKIFEEKYDYIFIEFYSEKNKKIIFNSDEKILLIKPNILGIKNSKKIIEKNKLNKIKNLKIIINNYNKYSISEQIIKKIYLENEIIGKIKYKKEYEKLINENYIQLQINNKLYKKEIKKIINNL